MLGYVFAQSPLLYASLLFVIINTYSVYSIYFGVGHFNFIQGYIICKKDLFLGRFGNQKFHHISNIFC